MNPGKPAIGQSAWLPTSTSHVRQGRKRVDALTDLICDDPKIERDAETLMFLRNSARRSIGTAAARSRSKIAPTLYRRYRGTDFPLARPDGSPLQDWRYLTPWMKTQIAALCLEEREFRQFKVHFHDQLLGRAQASWD